MSTLQGPPGHDPELLDRIARAWEVELTTRRTDGSPRRTIVWIVVTGDQVLVRSVKGVRGRWYQEALAHPEVTLHVDGLDMPERAVPVTDAPGIAACSAALEVKYRGDVDLPPMLLPEVLGTTLRLDPA